MDKFLKKLSENKIVFWICFGLIILLAIGLRLSVINFALWYDEGCSIATAINSFPSGINDYLWSHDLQHTPLYFYILHFIMQIFGDNELVLRVSSLIVSLVSLPVTYIVTKKLSSSDKIGLVGMLFMSVNTFQVLYSIEIRMYPYVILLSLLAINYLIDYDKNGDTKSLIKLSIANILNPYFLTGSIVFVLAQIIVYSIYLDLKKSEPKKINNYIKSNIITAICLIPYFIIVGHYAIVRSNFLVTDLSEFSIINFWGLLQNLFCANAGHIHETRFENFSQSWDTICLVFLPLGIMFAGLWNALKDKEKLNSVVLGIISLCFIIFVSLANAKIIAFTGRYLIFISPFLFILTAIGLSKLNKYLYLFLILLYTILCCIGLSRTYNTYQRIAYFSLKAPAEYVKKNYMEKDNLVIMPFASSVSFYYFKDKNMPKVLPLELFNEVRNPDNENFYNAEQRNSFKNGDKYKTFQKIITGNGFISENFVKYIKSSLDKVPRGAYVIWVVYYSDNYAIQKPEIVKQVFSNIDAVKSNTMTGMLSKFDNDLIVLLSSQFNFIKRERDDSNSYFVFKKR